MKKLVAGVHKFQKEIFGKQRELFERLAQSQEPETLFITCSDSRINPVLLTQTDPGEVFILRNAGNLIPTWGHGGGEEATIEYAVTALGVKDIIVCGHTQCGAMRALLQPPDEGELPAIRKWLRHAEITRQIVKEKYADVSPDELLAVTVQENVLGQLENLRTHPAVAARLARGALRLHGWVYKLQDGSVHSYEPEEGQFRPLAEVDAARNDPARLRFGHRLGA